MPEIVNTSFLGINEEVLQDDRPCMIKIDHVSMVFNIANEQLNSLKEYAIALARNELRFKEFRALDDITFEVKKGDVFGILGTNGSGKSTLLKIIAGVLDPTTGHCEIHGNIAPLIELGAGFDMELTARENIYLNGSLLGYSKKFINEHFDEIVDFAEVRNFLDMPIKNYSSGMVARIAFAIATVIVPDILIVDEVLSVGDFMFQKKCEDRIQSLIKDHGVTVLIVSHNNDQIERLCNKAIWIEKGHVRMAGAAHDVCRVYRVLGGHVGSSEAEQKVLAKLTKAVDFDASVIKSISANSKYGIAARLSSFCAPENSRFLILAPGETDMEAPISMGLAGALEAPVLITQSDNIPDVVAQEIQRLNPREIIVPTIDEKISATVSSLIREATGVTSTISIISANTYEDLSIRLFEFGTEQNIWRPGCLDSIIITYTGCTGDLISLSPYAYATGTPVLLKHGNDPIPAQHSEIVLKQKCRQLLVLGGQASFPDKMLTEYVQAGIHIQRFCGADPYDANKQINDWIDCNSDDDASIRNLVVSPIQNATESLTTGYYAAKTNSLLLFEDPQNLNSVALAIEYIESKQGEIEDLVFIGDKMRFSDLDKAVLLQAVYDSKQQK